jgi:hypothetical protein
MSLPGRAHILFAVEKFIEFGIAAAGLIALLNNG